jgi:hypothetical protein
MDELSTGLGYFLAIWSIPELAKKTAENPKPNDADASENIRV